MFELYAFSAQQFRRSRDHGHAPFPKNFKDHIRTDLETCASNLKCVALTVFELLTFNAQNIWLTGRSVHTDRHYPMKTLSPLFNSFTWRR